MMEISNPAHNPPPVKTPTSFSSPDLQPWQPQAILTQDTKGVFHCTANRQMMFPVHSNYRQASMY